MPRTIKPPLPDRTRDNARTLRRTMTDAEQRLWFHIRGGRLNGLKFRRQHPWPPYVLDFYCEEAKLGIELDGSQHNDSTDAARTATLHRQGLTVLRFWDNDVLSNTQSVLEAILAAVGGRTLTPTPLPKGEGL
jgi:very-short-patch-repair endonuclease